MMMMNMIWDDMKIMIWDNVMIWDDDYDKGWWLWYEMMIIMRWWYDMMIMRSWLYDIKRW